MPIGDILAQIGGGKPSPSASPGLQRSNTAPKRKADDDPRPEVSKTPRTATPTPKPSQPPQAASRQTPSQPRPNGGAAKPALPSKRPDGAPAPSKPSGPARPAPTSANGAAPQKAPPKKGSFAEIMARGQRAQTVMGQVGKIQHKKVEGASALKKREETKMGVKAPDPKRPTGYSGTARPVKHPSESNASNGVRNGMGPRAKFGTASKPGPGSGQGQRQGPGPAKKAAMQEQEKKVKKAAQATTGYAGTSRPKPGATAKKDKAAPRGGALLNRQPARPPSSKKSRHEDDYDEDMDDFIDYDDEEDEGGPRYDYASDASSDMEAGMDDIDVEERAAEQTARREDAEEERLEKSLKAAKEDRKRQALEALRAGRRR